MISYLQPAIFTFFLACVLFVGDAGANTQCALYTKTEPWQQATEGYHWEMVTKLSKVTGGKDGFDTYNGSADVDNQNIYFEASLLRENKDGIKAVFMKNMLRKVPEYVNGPPATWGQNNATFRVQWFLNEWDVPGSPNPNYKLDSAESCEASGQKVPFSASQVMFVVVHQKVLGKKVNE